VTEFDSIEYARKKNAHDAAERRARWEPLYEVTQMKGDGEAHPSLSTNDEFADFETWDKGQLGPAPKTPDMLPKEYAREALKRGLAYEVNLGVNPFEFGMIGSTDTHTSLSTTTEDNFFGKVSAVEPTANPVRFEETVGGIGGDESVAQYARETSPRGSPRFGRGRTPAKPCGTPWRARRSMPPPARAFECACSAASTSEPRICSAPTLPPTATPGACPWGRAERGA
jgi:hypothetical protein